MNSYHHSFFHSSGKPWQESFFHSCVELSCKIRFHWHKNTVIAITIYSIRSFSTFYLDSSSLMQKAQIILIQVRETNRFLEFE